MGRNRLLLILDTILFVSLVLLLAPGFSDLPVHEWLGLAVAPLIVIHILYGWRWIVATLVKLTQAGAWRARVNFLLNALQFIAFTVTIFSGAMTSFIALPALGFTFGNFESWRTLHNQWSNAVLILAALHIAMNWNWIVGMVRRHVLARPTAKGDAAVGVLAAAPPES